MKSDNFLEWVLRTANELGSNNRHEYHVHLAFTGTHVGTKVRFEFEEKTFRYFDLEGNPKLPEGINQRDLHLYGWAAIGDADEVVVVEGEHIVQALKTGGIVAVSPVNLGEVCDEAIEILKGKRTIVWPDADLPREDGKPTTGDIRADYIINRLKGIGVENIRRVKWDSAPPKGDAVDALNMGLDVRAIIDQAIPVNMAKAPQLLDRVLDTIHRFMVIGKHEANTLALWVLHTHIVLKCLYTPYINIRSAEPDSGKSLLLDILEGMVKDGMPFGSSTVASLRDTINELHPTVLFDESDSAMKGDKDDVLRGFLNNGFRKGRGHRKMPKRSA